MDLVAVDFDDDNDDEPPAGSTGVDPHDSDQAKLNHDMDA
jgi:hypothetical protein